MEHSVVFLYIHPELAVRLCRSRGSFTISVFWALCTSATNIVGLNWFARGFNLVNPKQFARHTMHFVETEPQLDYHTSPFHFKELAGQFPGI